jgi:hypothetical protein
MNASDTMSQPYPPPVRRRQLLIAFCILATGLGLALVGASLLH